MKAKRNTASTVRRGFVVSLALAITWALALPGAQAATYYWDANDSAAGFGTAGGTWGTDGSLTTSEQGTLATAGTVTTTADILNFGSTTTGLGAGTINVNNTQSISAFVFASGSGAIALSGGTINFGAAGTITVNNTSDTIGSIIAGAATSLTKNGVGTLILTGANSYSGKTTIVGGTLTLSGGNNRIKSGGTVSFDGANGSSVTLDLLSNSQTLSNITFPAAAGYNVSGGSLTVNINGVGGTLIVNGNNDLVLGVGSVLNSRTDVNMSGLANFIYSASAKTFRVGPAGFNGGATPSNNGVITLANANTITAATLAVNDSTSTAGGGSSTLHLGTSNALNVNTINMGTGSRNSATLDFAVGLTSPTVTIRNTSGGSVTTWAVGTLGDNNPRTWNNSIDLSAGTVDANVATMNIASGGRGGTLNGSVTIGATSGQNFTVGALNVGVFNSNTALVANMALNGTFTLNNAAGMVTATTITLDTNTGTPTLGGFTATVRGTFNLSNGTLNASTVQRGAQTGSATTSTGTFNWTTGTIGNIAGSDLVFTSVPITLLTTASHTFNISGSNTAALDANSPISGATFGITKAGTGTLTLAGTSTFSGATTINGGKLLVAGALANTGTVTVNNSGLLGGTGVVAGLITVASGGTLSPGNSTGTLTAQGSVTLETGSFFVVNLTGPGAYSQLSMAGSADTLTLNNPTLKLVAGSYVPTEGTPFTIITGYSTLSGGSSFISGSTVADDNNQLYSIQYNAGGGDSIILTAIPEPFAAGLLLLGLGALLLGRRRSA